jgi:hypothetical protein
MAPRATGIYLLGAGGVEPRIRGSRAVAALDPVAGGVF